MDFMGVLDYIFYTSNSLKTMEVLQPIELQEVKGTRLPNPYYCSDHTSLMAEIAFIADAHRHGTHHRATRENHGNNNHFNHHNHHHQQQTHAKSNYFPS
jgi:hypothetical protein